MADMSFEAPIACLQFLSSVVSAVGSALLLLLEVELPAADFCTASWRVCDTHSDGWSNSGTSGQASLSFLILGFVRSSAELSSFHVPVWKIFVTVWDCGLSQPFGTMSLVLPDLCGRSSCGQNRAGGWKLTGKHPYSYVRYAVCVKSFTKNHTLSNSVVPSSPVCTKNVASGYVDIPYLLT